jgi:hypothetical protein
MECGGTESRLVADQVASGCCADSFPRRGQRSLSWSYPRGYRRPAGARLRCGHSVLTPGQTLCASETSWLSPALARCREKSSLGREPQQRYWAMAPGGYLDMGWGAPGTRLLGTHRTRNTQKPSCNFSETADLCLRESAACDSMSLSP